MLGLRRRGQAHGEKAATATLKSHGPGPARDRPDQIVLSDCLGLHAPHLQGDFTAEAWVCLNAYYVVGNDGSAGSRLHSLKWYAISSSARCSHCSACANQKDLRSKSSAARSRQINSWLRIS